MTDANEYRDGIHFLTFGRGPKQVLALHCCMGRASGWRALAAEIEDQVTMTAPSFPGHGRSYPWPGTDFMRETALRVAEDFAPTEGPFDLIGHSFGAVVSLEFASRYPERVRSLTLFEPPYVSVGHLDQPALVDAHLEDMQPVFDGIASGDTTEAARVFLDLWGDGTKWDNLPPAVQAGFAAEAHLIAACSPLEATHPQEAALIARLARLDMPVCLMLGQGALEVTRVITAALAARIPQAEIIELAGAGHMGPITHAAAMAKVLREFWARAETKEKAG